MDDASAPFRFLAAFADEDGFDKAIDGMQRAGGFEIETFTPMPPRAAPAHSPVPRLALSIGLVGVTGGFAMQVYANVAGYPLDIGGRPEFSWPSFVPIAFEIGVGLAIVGVMVSAFVAAGFLNYYDPVDDAALMRRALSDRWLAAIRALDHASLQRARDICAAAGASDIEEIS